MRRIAFASLLLIATAASAQTVQPIDARWSEVTRNRDGDCRLNITSEGRFFRIAASGLGSGEPARFFLSNGDMKPIAWRVRANERGEFARYYLPFRWHREGDTVAASLVSESCELFAAFDWERNGAIVR